MEKYIKWSVRIATQNMNTGFELDKKVLFSAGRFFIILFEKSLTNRLISILDAFSVWANRCSYSSFNCRMSAIFWRSAFDDFYACDINFELISIQNREERNRFISHYLDLFCQTFVCLP